MGEAWPPPPARATGELRTVDLWAAGKWLTTEDNTVFLPTFIGFLRSTAAKVRRRQVSPCPFPEHSPEEVFQLLYADDETDFREQFWLMHWGENVDNVTSYAYLDADDLVIVFSHRRAEHHPAGGPDKVSVTRIPADEFATVLDEAADLLDAELVR
nr:MULTISPECIES: hypothetical protein [unclassified Actinoplanes]